jgi:hypothetical protein
LRNSRSSVRARPDRLQSRPLLRAPACAIDAAVDARNRNRVAAHVQRGRDPRVVFLVRLLGKKIAKVIEQLSAPGELRFLAQAAQCSIKYRQSPRLFKRVLGIVRVGRQDGIRRIGVDRFELNPAAALDPMRFNVG